MTDTPTPIETATATPQHAATPDTATPQTWDELTRQPGFATLPTLTLPQSFTIEQSATFEIARSRINRGMRHLSELGVFDQSKPLDDDKTDDANITIAEIVNMANMFFQQLSADKDAWDAWTRGRSLGDSLELMLQLVYFYGEQLGKSSESRMTTTPTASN